jgi:hypothetical protein
MATMAPSITVVAVFMKRTTVRGVAIFRSRRTDCGLRISYGNKNNTYENLNVVLGLV